MKTNSLFEKLFYETKPALILAFAVFVSRQAESGQLLVKLFILTLIVSSIFITYMRLDNRGYLKKV